MYLQYLFHFGTSNAPTGCTSPAASVHVPTGLKDIFRLRDDSRLPGALHGWYSSIVVRRSERDMMGVQILPFFSEEIPDDFSRAAASASVALRWLPQ
jgi:hypothetical protein